MENQAQIDVEDVSLRKWHISDEDIDFYFVIFEGWYTKQKRGEKIKNLQGKFKKILPNRRRISNSIR